MKYPKSAQPPAAFVFLAGIHLAHRRAALFVERAVRELNLTGPEAHLLGYVGSHPDGPLSELVRVFGHKRSTLTSMLDRLEARGLLRRASSPEDRRSFLVRITPAGRRTSKRAQEVAVDLERAIATLVRPEDAAAFTRVLAAFAQAASLAKPEPRAGTGPGRRSATRRRARPARRSR